MKNRLLIFMLLSILATFFAVSAKASDHPKAHFGAFGIERQPNLQAYKDAYLGKTVMYLPAQPEPGYDDKNKFVKDWKGKFNTEYIVSKISGNDRRIKMELVEKNNPKAKAKFVFNNQNEYHSYGDYTYCITKEYSVPILVVDNLQNAIAQDKNIGKTFGFGDNDRAYEVMSIVMSSDFATDKVDYSSNKYPIASYLVRDNINGNEFVWPLSDINDLNNLGKVFTNPKIKASYQVIGLSKENSKTYPYNLTTFYTVKNSETGETKKVPAASVATDAFKDDLSGKYIATLSKVEKPSNPSVRYGTTTEITEDGKTKFSYVDDYIDILIFVLPTQFSFVLKNVSDNTIKVVWNEAVFVDSDGSTSKIMHSGTKYSQREADQPATTIIKGAKIDDLAAPTNKVRYSDVLKEWVNDSMFPSAPAKEVEPIRLMLPIAVKDVINEYIFEFNVEYVYDHPERLNLE